MNKEYEEFKFSEGSSEELDKRKEKSLEHENKEMSIEK